MTAMEGWKTGKLGGLCSIEIGGTPSRSNPDYWDSAKETTNRWVSIRDLNRRVVSDTAEHITGIGARHSNVKLQKAGTVLLSFKLSIGRVAFAGCDLYTNEAIAGLYSEELDSEFLFYGLQQWDLLQNVDQAIKGATLNKEKLKLIEFKYPTSKRVQAQIATILSTIDRAIEQTEAIIAKQQRIKTGLMQDLLTKGIDEHGVIRSEATHMFRDSPLGRIPVEWEVERLEALTTKIVDGVHHTPKYLSEGIPFVTITDITAGEGISFENVRFISPADHAIFVKRADPRPGDVLVTKDGTLGVARVVTDCPEFSIFVSVAQIRPKKDVCTPELIWSFFESGEFRIQLGGLSAGTGLAHIHLEHFREFKLRRPPYEEQIRIFDFITKQYSVLSENMASLRKLHSQKRGLMHDLLTGTVRVDQEVVSS